MNAPLWFPDFFTDSTYGGRRQDRKVEWVPVAIVGFMIGLVAVLALAIPASIAADNEWARHCTQDLGGHVISRDTTRLGVSSKDGSSVIIPGSESYCLSRDGGILDIR